MSLRNIIKKIVRGLTKLSKDATDLRRESKKSDLSEEPKVVKLGEMRINGNDKPGDIIGYDLSGPDYEQPKHATSFIPKADGSAISMLHHQTVTDGKIKEREEFEPQNLFSDEQKKQGEPR